MIGGFVIPRAAPSDVLLRSLPIDSRDGQELLSDLQSCKSSPDFNFRINEIVGIESISNAKLSKRFSERRNELRADGSTVRECHAFAVVTSRELLEDAAREKSITPSLVDTTGLSFLLGNPSMGVHAFKTAESALLHYGESRHWQNFYLISFKVLLAKGNVVKAQPSKGGSLLEPQPLYDHHLTRDTSGRANELLYIFEYDEEAEIVESPRSILPLTIYQYKLNGEPFKRVVPATPTSNVSRKPKPDSERIAAIIKMKKEQAAAEEAKRLEALKLVQANEQTAVAAAADSLQGNEQLMDDDGDVEMVDAYEYADDVEEEELYLPFTGPQLVPLCADVIKDCGYDTDKPLCANRQALALSNSTGVAFNSRAILSLRRSGRLYCREKKTAEENSLVQICRQLPEESPISAAFHLVIGFIRYQLGDRSVQVDLPTVNEVEDYKDHLKSLVTKIANTAKPVDCVDEEVQCDLAPEITLESGPAPQEENRTSIITSSVAIQCNLNKLPQNVRQRPTAAAHGSARPQGGYSTGQHARQQNNSFDLNRPSWQGRPSLPAGRGALKPQPIVMDDDRRTSGDDSENDEHFVLRLIVEAITESTNRRPSSTTLDRLEQAFFRSLNRTQCAAERDRILLDLANYSQQGRWQLCLEKLGVAYSSLCSGDVAESVTRSRAAGQMWAQSLIAARQQGSPLDDLSRRKISRYADDIFDDSIHDVSRDPLVAATERRRPAYCEPTMPKIPQIAAQSSRTLSRASLLQLQEMLFQRKSDDIASVLRAVSGSRQRSRIDDISLYSQLLNFRRNIP